MKKQLFSFVMMLALVIVAGSVFGQGTNKLPWVGVDKTYTVTGLTDADTYAFYVTSTSVTLPTSANDIDAAGNTYAFVSGQSGTVASAQAVMHIIWKSTTTYRLWIETSRAGCSNYRYVTVTPENAIDFSITGIGSGLDTYDASAAGDDGGNICAVPYNTNYDQEGGSYNSGSTYVYFKVFRTNGITANNWSFTLAMSLNAINLTSSDIQFSNTGTGAWNSLASLNITVTAQDNYYLRVPIALLTNANRDIVGTISAMLEANTGLSEVVSAPHTANNTDTSTLKATPATGTFTDF